MIAELLSELDALWNASEDERCKGEHPGCARLQEEIEEAFKGLTEDELRETLDNLPDEQMEQIAFVLESMADERPFVEKYLK